MGSPNCCRVLIGGVGAEYECPSNSHVCVSFQLWSAILRMPFGLGKCVILEYIKVVLGFIGVHVMGAVGWVSKRKVWRIDQKCPKGSITMSIRTMLQLRRSPMTVSPVVVMPVVESVLLSGPIFFFHISVDVNWHWPLILL